MDETDFPTQDEFRFEEIHKIKEELEIKIGKRSKLYKRYKKAANVLNGLETTCFVAGITIASVGAATIITSVVSIPISVLCIALGLSGKIILPQLEKKVEKHKRIKTLTETSLNSINNIISKSINNEHISASEFELIIKETENLSSHLG